MEVLGEESMQYQIEVQEGVGDGNGEVIIIYNCNGCELTPEMLANTLTEISKQAAMEQPAVNSQPDFLEIQHETQDICVQNLNSSDQYDTQLFFLPEVKEEMVPKTESTIAENPSQTEYFFQNPLEIKVESIDESVKSLQNNPVAITITNGTEKELTKAQLQESFSAKELNTDMDIKDLQVFGTIEEKTSQVESLHSGSVPGNVECNVTKAKNHYESEETDIEETKQENFMCESCDFVTLADIELQRHRKSVHNVEEPFKCSSCDKVFKLELSLEIHNMIHSKTLSPENVDPGHQVKEINVCPLCDYKYRQKMQLTIHVKKEHKGTHILRCSWCNFACLSQEELEFHRSASGHSEEVRTLCSQCGVSCKNIKRHIKIAHSSERPFLCTDCGFRAKCITNLNAHMMTHSSDKKMLCTICDYKCHTKNQLHRHMVRHSTEKKCKCSYSDCAFACKTKGSLKRHMLIHQSDSKYICSVCGHCARDRVDLKRHKLDSHPRNVSFDCKECSVSFQRVSQLKKHALAVHRSSKICFCAYCDFSCETPQELRNHMQFHYGKYSYACDKCGYTCRLKSLYKRHMARHNKERRFLCSQCNYACSENGDLQKHVLSKHSQDKPYSCPHCNYSCKFQVRLNNHIAYVHSEIRPYFCKLCPYSGKSAENLRKHMGIHTGMVKTIRCVLCDYATAEKSKLKRHMQVHIKRAVFE